jgi:hypothetical protein
METTTETETDPRRVRLAEIEAELIQCDEEERAARSEIPEFNVANVGNGEVAARIHNAKTRMYECDSRRGVLKAERKSILRALNDSVSREARKREAEILGAVREHLAVATPQLEDLIASVRETRAGSQTPVWRHDLTPADVARVAASGGSLVDPAPEDSPAFARGR